MTKSQTNPQVDAYLSNTKQWQAEFNKLRTILLSCELAEELKWGKPCYTFQGSNVVIVQGFKAACALLFCKGALLKDPEGILKKPGEHTQAARRILFTTAREITSMEAVLKTYIREAVAVEKAGLEVTSKKPTEFAVPAELQKKMEEDAAFKAAFKALTPGRQRGYFLHFAGAKQATTRQARIEKCTPQILKGKGFHDR